METRIGCSLSSRQAWLQIGKEIGRMYHKPSEMEPLMPSGVPDLEDLAREVRNGDEITSSTMHHSFRPPLPDLKSQKHQNSLLFLQLLCPPWCYGKTDLSAIFFVGTGKLLTKAYRSVWARDLRSNKFDPNLCACLGKLFRPRSL
jgi:hypothetical protein